MYIIKTINQATGEEREYELPNEDDLVINIGRQREGNDIAFPNDTKVSRHHACILLHDNKLMLKDLGSKGGTYINGFAERIGADPFPLNPGDEIRLGKSDSSLVIEEEADDLLNEDKDKDVVPPVPPPKPPKPNKIPSSPAKETTLEAALKDLERLAPLYTPDIMECKKQIHNIVLEKLSLNQEGLGEQLDDATKEHIQRSVEQTVKEMEHIVRDAFDRLDKRKNDYGLNLNGKILYDNYQNDFRQMLLDELLELGPLSALLKLPLFTEIMVNSHDRIFVECKGKLYKTPLKFMDESHLMSILQRIVEPLGKHVDDSSPMVDARLKDGSRVNAVINPLALDGISMTIRKFAEKKLTVDDLIGFNSMTQDMADFLAEAVRSRQNIVVSGGTGSGKTTLLNVLSQFIPEGERIVTVEDTAELKLSHENIVRLEARPPNIEGKGRITIRDLVINTLRMRPDRIIVGECRGAEALDMLQAMNTGHDGSLTTCHANDPKDALMRLENMVMMAGFELPSAAIHKQIASAVNLIVQQTRMPDGSRKITKITEITGLEGDIITFQDIFAFRQTGFDSNGKVLGNFEATGIVPSFVEDLRASGNLKLDMNVFVPKA